MTRISLRPCPLPIPPAPRAITRAAPVTDRRDVMTGSIAWHADIGTKYVRPADDMPRDVADMVGDA